MKLQVNTLLALYSVLDFAADPQRHIPAAEIAGRYGVSAHHLAKVLAELARAGIVESVRGVGGGFGTIVQGAVPAQCRDQDARDARAFAGDHERAVAAAHEGRIELGQHLLGAAHGVATHRGERVGDAQHGEHQSGPSTPKRASVSAACARQRTPSRPVTKHS